MGASKRTFMEVREEETIREENSIEDYESGQANYDQSVEDMREWELSEELEENY